MKHILSAFACTFLSMALQAQGTHPVYFKLFSPGTLYGDVVKQAVFCDSVDNNDPVLLANHAINEAIINAFVQKPWLFTTTQTSIDNQNSAPSSTLVDEQPAVPKDVIAEKDIVAPTLVDEDVDLEIVPQKPNFWTFDGNGSVQFTQNYYSDNWYQGGENNYAMLALLRLHAKYDNKQRVQWETTLDCKLGFQTVDNDDFRKIRVNNDQIRLTTKFGYKAANHWYYTIQGESTTQFCKAYEPNTPNVISDFTSPIKTVVSVGMDYKFEWKRLAGSAYIAPIAMTWNYVDRTNPDDPNLDLATRYGNDLAKHSKITWGPNVTINYTWKPWNNFAWTGRIYYFSNFEYVNLEWENTFTFTFNKYISAKLFVYPRFDDSSPSYRTDSGSYFMLKEWLSLGMEYSF